MSASGGGLQGDLVAEGFELADVVALLALWADAGVGATATARGGRLSKTALAEHIGVLRTCFERLTEWAR